MRTDIKIALYILVVGLGSTVAAMALPLRCPNIPPAMLDTMLFGGLFSGIGAILLILYELTIRPRLKKEVKMINLLMIISGILLVLCGVTRHIIDKNPLQKEKEKQFYSKLILSIQQIEIADPKSKLTINLLFNNDGTKEFIINNLHMITPGNQLLTLDEHDNLSNNFNNKATLEYKMSDGKIIYPAGYYGLGAIKSGFPKVIKPGELYPLKVNIPIIVNEFLKEKKLSNIVKIPIGLQIWAINYKGEKYEVTTYPIAELHIINDDEINEIHYNAQTLYNYEIEKCNKMPSRVKSITISPGPGRVVEIPPPPANTDVFEIKIK
jgi:hypothetical protein